MRGPDQAPAGERLAVRVARGELGATVDAERRSAGAPGPGHASEAPPDGRVCRFAALLLAGAVLAFVLSVRVGILLGLRLDRAVEARAAADEPGQTDEVSRR